MQNVTLAGLSKTSTENEKDPGMHNAMVLGFGGCFVVSVGCNKGNALTWMSDEIKASSEK